MSSPTTSYYDAESARRTREAIGRAQTEVQALLVRKENAVRDAERVVAEYESFRVAVPAVDFPASRSPNSLLEWSSYSAELRAAVVRLERAVASTRERLSHHMAALRAEQSAASEARRAALTGRISDLLDARLEEARRDQATRADTDAAATELELTAIEQLRRTSSRIRERLPPEVDAETLTRIDDLVVAMLDAKSVNRARALEHRLRVAESQGLQRLEVHRKDAADAEELLSRLRPLASPPAQALVPELTEVAELRARLTLDLRERAEGTWERCSQQEDRQYAEECVLAALQGLGYETPTGFATDDLAASSSAYVARSDWQDFEIRVRCDGQRRLMNFNLVFAGDRTALPAQEIQRRGQEVEKAWCTDVDRLVESLNEQGIRLRVERRVEPGTYEIPVKRGSPLKQRADRKKRRPQRREHE